MDNVEGCEDNVEGSEAPANDEGVHDIVKGLSYTRNCGQKVQWHGTYQDVLQVL